MVEREGEDEEHADDHVTTEGTDQVGHGVEISEISRLDVVFDITVNEFAKYGVILLLRAIHTCRTLSYTNAKSINKQIRGRIHGRIHFFLH